MDEQIRIAAMEYHRLPTPGKISVTPTKGLINQRDLALAYSPGVAAACDAIAADPAEARSLTSRGNLVAVITNGTAVLGLGNIGPLAGKPVMEGKACLFKKFAGIDVFDIEIAENDPEELVRTIARLEPAIDSNVRSISSGRACVRTWIVTSSGIRSSSTSWRTKSKSVWLALGKPTSISL